MTDTDTSLITVTVNDINLDTIVGRIVEYDDEGEAYETGSRTIADIIADKITERLVRDDRYPGLRDHVFTIREEEIRAAMRPAIDEAMARPIPKTNTYGERTGETSTLTELIIKEARAYLNRPADTYNRGNGTVLEHAIRSEVQKVLKTEVVEAVKAIKSQVTQQYISAVTQSLAAQL